MGQPAGATLGGGTARSLQGTWHSWSPPPCRLEPARTAQHLSGTIVWCLLAMCHPKGSLTTLGTSHAALILPSPWKPLTRDGAGG